MTALRTITGAAWAFCTSAAMAVALDLPLPSNAVVTAERNSPLDIYAAPVSVFQGGGVETIRLEGAVERSTWRIASPGLTPLQVAGPLRDALINDGYRLVLECAARICGGYDFRFRLETLPAPSMYVNIRAYHQITAVKGPEGAPSEVVSLLASASASAAHVQVIRAGAFDEGQRLAVARLDVPARNEPALPQPTPDALADSLLANGRFVLSEIEFASGTTQLGDTATGQLEELADFMLGQPNLRFALVGHTDSTGSLDGNVAVSRKRADAVRTRLISEYGISPAQVVAEGMGYLAPVASNLTSEGREANRRVEVILLRRE